MQLLRPYAMLWRIQGAPVLIVFGPLARLGISMTPLGMLLLIQNATGRYSTAAFASAMYTVALAAASPLAGRVADRVGRSPVLIATAAVHPVGLVALVVAARGRQPDVPMI